MVVLGVWAVSYERGTPVNLNPKLLQGLVDLKLTANRILDDDILNPVFPPLTQVICPSLRFAAFLPLTQAG